MADTVVPMTLRVPDGGAMLNKPAHLVVSSVGLFITLERPSLEVSWVGVRGFHLDITDSDVASEKWQEIVQTLQKSDMIEVYIPWQNINHIQNLVYRAK